MKYNARCPNTTSSLPLPPATTIGRTLALRAACAFLSSRMKGIDAKSLDLQPIASRTRSRCRDVSQSFDLSETITEKIEGFSERIEEFKNDVTHTFQEFKKEWSGLKSQAPSWQQQRYILRGYRIGLSMKETFLSLFVLHNETVNVWTHLVGSLYFLNTLVVEGPLPASYNISAIDGSRLPRRRLANVATVRFHLVGQRVHGPLGNFSFAAELRLQDKPNCQLTRLRRDFPPDRWVFLPSSWVWLLQQ